MPTWDEFRVAVPDLARLAEARLLAHKHLTMATIRRDGAPRISGTEAVLRDGDLWLAGMTGARRFADLRRDPRVALHSGSEDPDTWTGDAKVSGVAAQTTDPGDYRRFAEDPDQASHPGDFELFRVDITDVVVVRLSDDKDHLIIESWRPGRGLTRVERR